MAKARDIPDLSADASFADAAAQVVAVRAQELFDHADDVLDTTDIERVHDMRVATRRLRAVLEIFAPCFPKRLHRGVLRDVKALADALGERRDPDVHIAALDGFAAGVKAVEPPGRRAARRPLARAEQAAANVRLADGASPRAGGRPRGPPARAGGRRGAAHEGAPGQGAGPGRDARRRTPSGSSAPGSTSSTPSRPRR